MGILDNSFDRMFDFDRDGELDPIERFAQFEFLDEEDENAVILPMIPESCIIRL